MSAFIHDRALGRSVTPIVFESERCNATVVVDESESRVRTDAKKVPQERAHRASVSDAQYA